MKNPRSIQHLNALFDKLRTYVRTANQVHASWSGTGGQLRIAFEFEADKKHDLVKDFEGFLDKSTPEIAEGDEPGLSDSGETETDPIPDRA